MAEVGTNTDVGKRRRLPDWMLPKNSGSNEISTSTNRVSTNSTVQEQPKHDTVSNIRSMHGKRSRAFLKQDVEDLDNSGTDLKKKGKERHKKVSEKNANEHSSLLTYPENDTKPNDENEWSEVTEDEKAAPRKKPNRKGATKKSKMLQSSSASEDELDLTVEDLVCIAKQYVNSDKEKHDRSSTARQSESEAQTSGLLTSSTLNITGPSQSIGTNKTLAKCNTKMPSLSSSGSDLNERESCQAEDNAKHMSRTGNATQDMLDLLLGPLLKTIPVKEPELVMIQNDVSCASNQVRRESYNQEATIAKKKTSLKNQVAMLLD